MSVEDMDIIISSSSSSSTSDSSSDTCGLRAELKQIQKQVFSNDWDARSVEWKAMDEEEASSSIQGPKRRRRYINRGRNEGSQMFFKDYFGPNPTFPEDYFRRRYRMRLHLFESVAAKVIAHDPYFLQRRQCTGELGLHPYIKIAAALKMMAYGIAADACDEYLRLGETTTLKCLRHFTKAIVDIYAPEFLRDPNSDDMRMLLKENAERGFPGMLGSVDCMHWTWKNCPANWRGSYQNYKKKTTIVLEAIASKSGWIWHAFFGMPGSFNDVNVMNASGIFDRVVNGEMPSMPFMVNGKMYDNHYVLGDGIYPKFSTIVKSIRVPRGDKEKKFAAYQEGVRKDVERAFGQLQGRWGIIKRPAEGWSKPVIHYIMLACIILHNMIGQDERGLPPCDYETMKKDKKKLTEARRRKKEEKAKRKKVLPDHYVERIANYDHLRNGALHDRLKADLMDHIWNEDARGTIRICNQD